MTVGIALTLVLALAGCGAEERVPVWSTLPAFALVDQDARPFGTEQLRGKTWVVDFVFTKCPSRCPLLTREMANLQREIRDRGWEDVRLVSISVDPENDVPEVLAAYASRHGADRESWKFLTGERDEIWSLSVEGFRLAVAEAEDSSQGPILHSNRFVLADREGRIRGYYDALDEPQRAKLLRDLEIVRAESTTEAR